MGIEESPPAKELAGGCMIGDLESWPLINILVWLHESRRTAMLRVGDGLDAGVIFYRDGWLYRAEWGQLQGEEALLNLLGLVRGAFSLMLRDIPDARPNVRPETHEVLLQLTVARDEMNRQMASA